MKAIFAKMVKNRILLLAVFACMILLYVGWRKYSERLARKNIPELLRILQQGSKLNGDETEYYAKRLMDSYDVLIDRGAVAKTVVIFQAASLDDYKVIRDSISAAYRDDPIGFWELAPYYDPKHAQYVMTLWHDSAYFAERSKKSSIPVDWRFVG